VVEDDPEVRGLLVFHLSSHGFELVATDSLVEAKQHLDHEEFGAILLDPDLRDGDGLTLLDDAPLERVVILTSRSRLAGIADWPAGRRFGKPCDLEELSAKLDEILRYWPE